MYAAYPEIFRRHPRIEAYSTVVPRCIMSMAAFCEGLKEADPSLEIFTETSNVNMYLPQSAPRRAIRRARRRISATRAPTPLAAGVAPFLRGAYRRRDHSGAPVYRYGLCAVDLRSAEIRTGSLLRGGPHAVYRSRRVVLRPLHVRRTVPFLGVRQLYLLCRERARSAQPRARHGAGRDVARRHRVARRRGYGRRRTRRCACVSATTAASWRC